MSNTENKNVAEMPSIGGQRKLLGRFVPDNMDVDMIEEEAIKTNWSGSPVSIVEIMFLQRFGNVPRATLQHIQNNPNTGMKILLRIMSATSSSTILLGFNFNRKKDSL